MDALFRALPGETWKECELIAIHPRGYVVREVGRHLPGVMLADWSQIRVPRLSADELAIWREQDRA
jgi:hypothetical protein